MKLIIIESGDCLGKNTLIAGLCDYYNYDNIAIRHFGKPPRDLNPAEASKFQFGAFKKEQQLFYNINDREYAGNAYYDEIVIWNRSHLGEYVYSQMFREGNPSLIKDKLLDFEKGFTGFHTYLVTLTADPNFFLSKEDGDSFSQTLQDKTRELELFKEIHELSSIPNKLLVKVDTLESYHGDKTAFRPKEDILNEVVSFIN